jgi:hypothetical protein
LKEEDKCEAATFLPSSELKDGNTLAFTNTILKRRAKNTRRAI